MLDRENYQLLFLNLFLNEAALIPKSRKYGVRSNNANIRKSHKNYYYY